MHLQMAGIKFDNIDKTKVMDIFLGFDRYIMQRIVIKKYN